MTAGSLDTFWLPLLALLAVEVGAIAALAEVLRRWSSSAGWGRIFCQGGLVAVLVLSAGELSGAAGFVAGWLVGLASDGPTGHPALETNSTQGSGAVALPETRVSKSTERPVNPVNPVKAYSKVPGGTGRLGAPAGPRQAAELPAGFWLVLVWGAGALAVGGRVCFAHCVFVLFRLRRRQMADRALVERMERLARAVGLRRRVRVKVSARLAGPIAFGWIWPSVALPAGFAARLDRVKQDAVLLHELAHLAAHDPFWNLLADAATVVLWWHPAVWWLRRQLQLANELAADEASLLVADGPRVLAECLVQFGARLLERPVAGQIPVTGFRSHLGRRVQQLMRLEGRTWSPPRRLSAALARSFGAAATAAAVVLCTAWATPRQLTKGDSMKTMQQNWKQFVAAFAFLAAINGQDAVGREAQSEPAAATPAAPAAAPAAPAAAERFASAAGRGARTASALVPVSANRNEAKLKSIVLHEVVPMQSMPLSEVAKWLNDTARKLDPEGVGVNFLIACGAGAVDPATGLPAETVDLNSIGFSIPLPLHNVTLRDMLDILLKVSDRPIQYTVEEYGVLFSLKPQTSAAEPKPVLAVAVPERLSVRTFKVDTNTVVAAIDGTFHTGFPAPGADARSPETIETALRMLIDKLGLPPRSDFLFYNGLTGMLMVRASREDMEVISAAMETLTGLEQKRDPLQSEAGTAGKGGGSEISKGPNKLGADNPVAPPETGPRF
jgi:beta-lactamase regulating signal transducer with metallopeptidase domain